MATKKRSSKNIRGLRVRAADHQGTASLLSHRVSTLLHTVRCIAEHEDELCVLLHELKNSAVIRPKTHRDLSKLLEKMPSQEYTAELDAVRYELDERARVLVPATPTSPRPTKVPKKTLKTSSRRLKS